jgi:hypothetical protein
MMLGRDLLEGLKAGAHDLPKGIVAAALRLSPLQALAPGSCLAERSTPRVVRSIAPERRADRRDPFLDLLEAARQLKRGRPVQQAGEKVPPPLEKAMPQQHPERISNRHLEFPPAA